MTIQERLDDMRAQPEHIRRRYAFWGSLGFTAVIFVFWLGSFTGINIPAGAAVARTVDKAGTPGQSLVAGVGALGGDIWSMIVGPKKITYSEVEVLPGK
jgi:hypothetical protein